MVATVAHPRPDLAAHRDALTLPFPKIVTRLSEILGRKLVAYVARVQDVRALDRWVAGSSPYGNVEARLRFTYQVASMLADHDSAKVVQAWFMGCNPELGDRVPLRLLRQGDLDAIAREILGAARAFVAGA